MRKTKRLELILPIDHEIFTYPSGSWRAVATKFLDIGMQLSRIEKRLDDIEKSLTDLNIVEASRNDNTKSTESDKAKIARNIIQGFGIE